MSWLYILFLRLLFNFCQTKINFHSTFIFILFKQTIKKLYLQFRTTSNFGYFRIDLQELHNHFLYMNDK